MTPAHNQNGLVRLACNNPRLSHQQQWPRIDQDEIVHGAQANQKIVKGARPEHVMWRMARKRQRQNIQHALGVLGDRIRKLSCAEEILNETDLRLQASRISQLAAAEIAINDQCPRTRHGRHTTECERQACLAFIRQGRSDRYGLRFAVQVRESDCYSQIANTFGKR